MWHFWEFINDDQLFPGWLDFQIGLPELSEEEWTVDHILSHSGTGENSIFEIKWKAGDITWLPYNKISHLEPLEAYLQLLEMDNISNLPMRTGVPPDDDIQVALPEISILGFPNNYTEHHEHLLFIPSPVYNLLSVTMPKQITDNFKSMLNHSNIRQLSKTTFIFMHLDMLKKPTTALVHAAAITDSIAFDQLLWANPECIPKQTPLGYDIFAMTFSTGYLGSESFSYFCEYMDKVLIKGKHIK